MTPVCHDPFRDTLEGLVCGGALVLQDASALVGIVISIMQLILDRPTANAIARLRPIPGTDRFELFYWSNLKACLSGCYPHPRHVGCCQAPE